MKLFLYALPLVAVFIVAGLQYGLALPLLALVAPAVSGAISWLSKH